MKVRSLALVGLLVAGLGLSGCQAVRGCQISVVESIGALKWGDAVPAGALVIVAPGEIDASRTRFLQDVGGPLRLELAFTPAGSAKMAAYTRTHIGDLIALVVNQTVVSVPMIQAVIEDPTVEIAFPDEAEAAPLVTCLGG